MAQYNFNSNIDIHNFYISKYGNGVVIKNGLEYSIDNTNNGDRESLIKFKMYSMEIGDTIQIDYNCDAIGIMTVALIEVTSKETAIQKYPTNVNGAYSGRVTFAIPRKGNYIIGIGGVWNTNVVGSVKDINISVSSISSTFENDLSYQRLTIQSTSKGVFKIRDDWSLNTATLSNKDENTLQIALNRKPSYRYQSFVTNIFGGNSKDYICRTDISETNLITIRFYNAVTNVIVPLSEVKQDVYLGLLLV